MFLTVALTVALSLLTLLAAAPSCESLEEQHRCRNAEIIEPDEVVLLQIELTVNNSPSQQVTNNSDNANATMREDELSNAEKEDLEMFKRTKGSKAFSALDHFILEKLQNDSALRSMVVHGQLVKKDVKSRVTHALAHVLVGNRTSETEEITEVLDDQLDAMHQWWTHLSAARRYKKVAERTLFEMFLAHSAGSLDWLMLIPAIVLFMSEWYSKATDHSTPPADVTRLLLWWIVAGSTDSKNALRR